MNDIDRINWLEKVMTKDSDFCEIYLSGLRNFKDGNAVAFQIESNPEIFPTLNCPTLREAIDSAILTQEHWRWKETESPLPQEPMQRGREEKR